MKRFLTLCLCLMLMGTACAEQFVVYVYGGEEGIPESSILIREDGTLLTPPGEYPSIYAITPANTPAEDRLYAAWSIHGENGGDGCALMDANGQLLTGFEFWYINWLDDAEQVAFSRMNGLNGCMDRQGRVLVEGEYESVLPNGEGGWLALSSEDGEILHIDESGVFPTGYHAEQSTGSFREGLCPVNGVREFGGQSVYLDAKGRPAFERTFCDALDYHGALAPVAEAEDYLYGLIDRKGNTVVEARYTELNEGNGVFLGVASDRLDVFDCQTGERLASIPLAEGEYCWEIAQGLLCVNGEDGTRYYDYSGNALARQAGGELDCPFSEWDAQPQRLASVSGEWPGTECRLVDLNGDPVGPAFQSFNSALWREGQGRLVFSHFTVRQGADGYPTADWRDWRYGLCDENGRVLLEPLYSELTPLSLDLCWGRLGSRVGLIDRNGNWLYTLNDYEYLMD